MHHNITALRSYRATLIPMAWTPRSWINWPTPACCPCCA